MSVMKTLVELFVNEHFDFILRDTNIECDEDSYVYYITIVIKTIQRVDQEDKQ